MGVDLQQATELTLDKRIENVVDDLYCASCTYHETREKDGNSTPFCTYWDDTTEISLGWICEEYIPQGFEYLDDDS